MKIITLSLTALTLLSAGHAFAEGPQSTQASATAKRDAVVEKREQEQEKRIENGEKSGQLTQQEAARLEKREAKIKTDEANAMKDGKMSNREYRRLVREQNQASSEIYRKKHNRGIAPQTK